MMTFFDLLTYLGGVDGATGDSGPATGTHLSTFAIELPHSITPAIAGLTVGSVVGVVGFVLVMLLVGRGNRRPSRRRARADEVVFVPAYGTMPRETPLPRAFGLSAHGFVPSNALSARAFAKMGYAADDDAPLSDPRPLVSCDSHDPSDPMLSVEIDMDEPSGSFSHPNVPAVLVSPVVVLSDSTDKLEPHPLGVIKSSSSAMQAAPIADLSFDDSPTEIGETYFDEPPQPRRRTDPPRIRKIAPAKPRFAEQSRNG
jgi:hypothetical protein